MTLRGFYIEQINDAWYVLNAKRQTVQICKTEKEARKWVKDLKIVRHK